MTKIEEEQWLRARELLDELSTISTFNKDISFAGAITLKDGKKGTCEVAFSGSIDDILINYREVTAHLFRLIVEKDLKVDTDAIKKAYQDGLTKGMLEVFMANAKGDQADED
ncbi:hypothetical protein [Listeria monocytogenes]|uniref:Uncharacterized protein n=1 Tax=Listeria monocytogenes TaxID=1639 RepID=A0A6C8N1V8_LISMN|nr:hypothetical protein [Listeria monocytogenes]KAA9534093.1 hypothetical protein DCK33_08100 [Listeria monocytogenes]KAA9541482.1 hypothetical protein DCK32_10365 [Listeria monocytogenes]